ncbi:hypothetical protein Gorai_022647 [Gossypium raimondii]|uniref:Replication protein A C-terminal domain-containing protein n=1 Tax=Gossypium raimondii TaxID=29730 RepID=A0A7J8NTU0_GOSRA|nr:hypothetical protein [Gossypium raimondii]
MYVHLYNTNLKARVEALVCKMTLSALETRVSSNVMARELNVSYDKIKKSLKFIASEGLLYTTIDDHYKFTDV